MKRILSILIASLLINSITFAVEPDMIVTQSGESIKVYNIEIAPKTIFYTITEDENSEVQKMSKEQILVIKKADGSIVNPNSEVQTNATPQSSAQDIENPAKHEPVTFKAIEKDFMEIETKKAKKDTPAVLDYYILVGGDNDQVLNMRLLSRENMTLSVAALRKDQKYILSEITIPEYVDINGKIYTVTEIDDHAFNLYKDRSKGYENIRNIIFPETLKKIGNSAFFSMFLKKIILPESIETIGNSSFHNAGSSSFEQLYIPKSVKNIGKNAFIHLGSQKSFNGYFQGKLTSIPDFISTGNCTFYGIDEEAVEAYLNRNK